MIKNAVMAKCREFLTQAHYRVWSFGDNRALRHGARDFVDLVAANGQGKVIFIEVKTKVTKDELSTGQKETAEILAAGEKRNKRVYYRVVNEDNYRDVIISIMED